jgi:hypothetical protein
MINFLMIDITRRSFFKYWLFGSLYFSEGLLKAIAVVIFPIYLIGKDISPELITLVVGIGVIYSFVPIFCLGFLPCASYIIYY